MRQIFHLNTDKKKTFRKKERIKTVIAAEHAYHRNTETPEVRQVGCDFVFMSF